MSWVDFLPEILDEEERSHGKREPKGGGSTPAPDKGNEREKEARAVQEHVSFILFSSQTPGKIDRKNHCDTGEIITVYEKPYPRQTLSRIDTLAEGGEEKNQNQREWNDEVEKPPDRKRK
jgi:hypothetical protein